MALYQYRAVRPNGIVQLGTVEAVSHPVAIDSIRHLGLTPIEASETNATLTTSTKLRVSDATRKAVTRAISELAVLLDAGLALNRALGICLDNINHKPTNDGFATLYKQVKEGVPMSRAMVSAPSLFTPMACAMAEAGEANGQLGSALTKLSTSMERADELRATLRSSLIYPAILLFISVSVILVMLLMVVPQFETLFSANQTQLPPTTRAILAASHGLRDYGLYGLMGLIAALFGIRHWLRQPAIRMRVDRLLLRLPNIGPLITKAETARFARALGSLVEGGVPLPNAMAIAQRTVGNNHMAHALSSVTAGLRIGSGLTGPIAATGLFPKIAIGFLRTGEETARLGDMLERLADVLDRDVRLGLQNLMTILTPLITVCLGGFVAVIIASIMSAILGFNDVALAP